VRPIRRCITNTEVFRLQQIRAPMIPVVSVERIINFGAQLK
jgi:hypothetical protein